MIARKVAPALAAGCSIVVKPAAETPLSALAMCELAVRAGVPAGVLSCITGDAVAIGKVLTGHPAVRKFSFTGSTSTGKLLLAQCARTVKKTSMELGGNAPFIVFDDADLDEAVQGAMLSKFRNAGQTCVCTNRILVQDGVYERLVAKLAERVRGLRVGDGSDAQVDIGPLVDKRAIAKVAQLVDRAISQGAKVVEGGERLARPGYFFAPTLLVDVKPEMDICRQEIFGPVATVQRFGTEAEAIALANETDSGLAAYFYGRDMGRVWRVVDALEYGMVGVNEGLISTEVAPFGGIKESGTGREGSRHGIDDYLEFKYVCIGGLESRKIS